MKKSIASFDSRLQDTSTMFNRNRFYERINYSIGFAYCLSVVLYYAVDWSSLYRGRSTRRWHNSDRCDLPRVLLFFLLFGDRPEQLIKKRFYNDHTKLSIRSNR